VDRLAPLTAPDLAAAVAMLEASDAVDGVVVGEPPPTPPDDDSETCTVGDHDDKLACLARIAALAERAGLAANEAAAIEQCADELITNALYAAPGVFADVAPADRVGLRTQYAVQVRLARAGKRVAVTVRDSFGSLQRATVLAMIAKGLHAKAPVEHKAAGAGLGLYLVASLASELAIRIAPGAGTEITCVFDPSTPGLRRLVIVQEPASGTTPPLGPARRLRSARARRRILARAAAIAGGVAAVAGALAIYVVTRPGPPPPPAILVLASEPPGAQITVDGVALGTTPLTVTTLAPERRIVVVFALRGYSPVTVAATVPVRGGLARVAQPLARSPAFVRVRFVSDPPGAAIVPTGQEPGPDRTYTPADLFLERGKEQRFTLRMPQHEPLVLAPFTPANDVTVGGTLIATPE
jgi:histidine kinase-like protein/PEGA domain-containing protein